MERQKQLYARYWEKLAGKEGLDRVKELARLRDEDGTWRKLAGLGRTA